MAEDAIFTMKLEAELHDAFAAAAVATGQSAEEIIRAFMQDFVTDHQEALAHDAWLHAEIEQGLKEADDPSVERIGHATVKAEWERERTNLIKQIEEMQDKLSRPRR